MLCANNILACCSQIKVTGELLLTPSSNQHCFLAPRYLQVCITIALAAFTFVPRGQCLAPAFSGSDPGLDSNLLSKEYSHHQHFF